MQNIVIDISKRGVIPPIIVTEYDSMSRFFTLRLLNNGADYVPPENANYSVWYETNDSKGWYDTITLPDKTSRHAVVEDGNLLTVEVAEAATTSCGELAVMVTGEGGYQLTVSGIRLMSADVPGYDGTEVEDYYNVYIADMRKNAARAENAAQTAIEYGATIDVDEAEEELIIDHYDDAGEVETWATVSEAWAVGQRNGVDVPSTDETYHNNSKYYAGQAANSAVNSAASAETAEEAAELCFTTAIKTSASGAVASFSDGADNIPMQSLVAEITPVQSGSGDPSPTNIRPISGRTGLTVTRAGKNILNPALTSGLLSITVGALETDITPSGRYAYTERFPSTEDVILSIKSSEVARCEYAKIVQYVDGVVVAVATNVNMADTTTWHTKVMPGRPNSYCRIVIGGTTLSPTNNIYGEAQIEVGSTATAYEPYTAQTYPVTWESSAGTVYGGTLDVVSGVLTVKGVLHTLTGDENFGLSTNSRRFQKPFSTLGWERANTLLSTQNQSNSRCSHAIYLTGATATATPADYRITADPNVDYANAIVFYDTQSEFADAAAFNAYLAEQYANGTPVQLYYDLAQPQTYQLTPTEVRTILGGNTIYTDAGDVSVEYVADTKLYIDNKIAELQALILEH